MMRFDDRILAIGWRNQCAPRFGVLFAVSTVDQNNVVARKLLMTTLKDYDESE